MDNDFVSFGSSRPRPKVGVERGERLIGRAGLIERGVAYSDSHLRRMCADGRFPAPIRLSPRKLAWRVKEVEAWIAEKLAAGAER